MSRLSEQQVAAIKPMLLDFTIDVRPMIRALNEVDRQMRAWAASRRGQKHLAAVIREQPGRQIVREGMADVLEWLGEKP